MKVRNLFATLAAVGVVGLVADTAVAQVDVKPGGVTATGPAGNNLNVPFNGQAPTVTQPGTTPLQPGTAGTFLPGTSGYYPGASTYPGGYYQPMYGNNSSYQQPYMNNGYSYYTPNQQWGATNSFHGQQAVAGGGCCGSGVMPVSYNAGYAGAGYGGGCCGSSAGYGGMYSQQIGYGGGGGDCCNPCGGRNQRRGLFRR